MHLHDPVSSTIAMVPDTLLRTTPPVASLATVIPSWDSGREAAVALPPRAAPVPPHVITPSLPLAGVRVLEIGQYTTAPHAARQLALLGAEVIKIEPIEGEASRAWPPHLDGQGLFFTMNNSNKRSVAMDLRRDEDRAQFRMLLGTSDVLIENLKPGSLERLGFGRHEQLAINPRLIYCAISGFGVDSAYPGRAAFDTVVQAMSGIMALTQAEDGPVKLGPSIADIGGGTFGFFAVLVLLEIRDRAGAAASLDLSMQDVAAWLTHTVWNGAAVPLHSVIECTDGAVAVAGRWTPDKRASQAETLAALATTGLTAVPVRTVAEAAEASQTVARTLIERATDANGRSWSLFSPPYRLSGTSFVSPSPIGQLGEGNAELLSSAGEPRIV